MKWDGGELFLGVPIEVREARISVMIDHISFGVRDIEAAKQFYDAVLKPLGIVRLYGGADFAAYGESDDKDDLSIHQAGEGWVPDPKVHIAFCAPSRAAVEAFHRQGLAAGGLDDGEPAIRDEYAEDYFAAFLKDPDGQRIEAVCRLKHVEDISREPSANGGASGKAE